MARFTQAFGRVRQPDEVETVRSSYDVIGDIAIVRVPASLSNEKQTIAQAVMQAHRQVKTVLAQTGAVSGEYRLRKLEWVLGEKKTETTHKEWGCVFRVDVEKCYFSPRLSHERMRIARLAKPKETVVNMFAGVGCFSVLMAKHGKVGIVYSVDVNPVAVGFTQLNAKLNRVEGRVISILGDARKVIVNNLQGVADRVLMPLPDKAYAYLPYAVMALKPRGGWIHYYDFEHAAKGESAVEKVEVKVAERLRRLGVGFRVSFGRVVRSTGPNWYQVVLDIRLSRKVTPCLMCQMGGGRYSFT